MCFSPSIFSTEIRLQDLLARDPSKYATLTAIVTEEGQEGTLKKVNSFTRAILWLASLYDLANVVPAFAKFYHEASESYEQACTRHISLLIYLQFEGLFQFSREVDELIYTIAAEGVLQGLDAASATVDDMDEWLWIFNLKLRHMREDIASIRKSQHEVINPAITPKSSFSTDLELSEQEEAGGSDARVTYTSETPPSLLVAALSSSPSLLHHHVPAPASYRGPVWPPRHGPMWALTLAPSHLLVVSPRRHPVMAPRWPHDVSPSPDLVTTPHLLPTPILHALILCPFFAGPFNYSIYS
ncbi:hypothetical protein ABZP36_024553 [Zizania latifolia]